FILLYLKSIIKIAIPNNIYKLVDKYFSKNINCFVGGVIADNH
ncbi:hypothetical protein EZS27_039437, partial [termite gut metagenome]